MIVSLLAIMYTPSSELGFLLDRRYPQTVRPGDSFRMSFVVDGRQMQYDIVIPDAAPDTLTILSAVKGVICDILHLIYGLQTAYLQHKSTIFSKVFNSAIYRIV